MFITKKKLRELIEKERREWEQTKRDEDETARIWRRLDEMSTMFWDHDRTLKELNTTIQKEIGILSYDPISMKHIIKKENK